MKRWGRSSRRLAGALAAWTLALGASPGGAWGMPSESTAVFEDPADREAMVGRIMAALSRPQARVHLRMAGIHLPELREQLSRLDDAQLAEVARRADRVIAGGDALGILIALLVIAILIVILIYLLDKDIEIKDKEKAKAS